MEIGRSDTDLTPSGNNIFEKCNINRLKKTKGFHNSVTRGMFVAKSERPDIHQTAAVLSTRVE